MPPSAPPGIPLEPPAVHGPLPGDDETPRSTKRARELLYLFLDPTPPMRGGGRREGGWAVPALSGTRVPPCCTWAVYFVTVRDLAGELA